MGEFITISKKKVIEEYSITNSIPKTKADYIINDAINVLYTALRTAAPGYVFNFAPFGRFKIKTRPEKTVRDFRSGKIIKVPPQNVITFLPSKKFKKELNTDFFSKGE